MFDPKKIKEAREAAGLSQAELGRRLKVIRSRQHVHAWEIGLAQPNLTSLSHLAEVLGVGIEFFLDGREGDGMVPDRRTRTDRRAW